MRTNFTWVVDATQQAARRMAESGRGGGIVMLTSIEAHRAAPGFAVYASMKAALTHLARTLAVELGPSGIRVTCVAPGNVKTPRQDRWYTPEAEQQIVDAQCLKSRIEPAHVASLVLFLASDDAKMCTGHEYWIDAGWR